MIGTLVSKRQLCLGTWEYTFSYTEDLQWSPGDYTFITVPNISKSIDNQGLRRHISIANLPNSEKVFKIAVRLRSSSFKQILHTLSYGARVEFTKPYGEFKFPKNHLLPCVFIIGGIGITFCMSILESLNTQQSKRPITILFFNTTQEKTPYFDELREFEKDISGLSIIFSMTQDNDWNGERGRVDAEKITRFIPEIHKAYFYFIGPQPMNQTVEDILIDLNIADNHVWREDFTGYEVQRDL